MIRAGEFQPSRAWQRWPGGSEGASATQETRTTAKLETVVPQLCREVWEKLRHLEIATCPFANLPEKRRTQFSLTREEIKAFLAKARPGCAERVYGMDTGRALAAFKVRRIA